MVPALNRTQRAEQNQLAIQMQAQGWSPGLCRLAGTRGT
jgi:hypothetical protein